MAERKAEPHRLPTIAVILIFLGVIFLLQTYGAIPWGVWSTLWPVLLIMIGINIIFARINAWLAGGINLLILCAVVGLAVSGAWPGSMGKYSSGSFSEPLGSAERAEVELELGIGTLNLDSLPASSDRLLDVEYTSTGSPSREMNIVDGTARVSLELGKDGWRFWGFWGEKREEWQVNLSQRIPLELSLHTGAGDSLINLSELTVTKIDLDMGVGRVNVTLPAAGATVASVKGGVGDLTLTIPQGVAARIEAHTGVGVFEVDESRFPKAGDLHESPDYATADNRVDLRVNAGVGRIRIR